MIKAMLVLCRMVARRTNFLKAIIFPRWLTDLGLHTPDSFERGLHCPDHIHQGSIMAGPSDANCAVCHSQSNVTNQLFCVTCEKHYHGSCVGLGSGPGV
ncbi:hypothetical protein OUZ56_011394 [Daphnia magna]|uniref:PHD-type domain-containing protein n=1 Tax=Daphnia magna TaxID=35525 RepID=A0ABQ9Z009_9CRUS|nr:hypothetical protein OUZ56_011394 [Daphnia magna]